MVLYGLPKVKYGYKKGPLSATSGGQTYVAPRKGKDIY
jgi:hypothetical protein